MGNLYAMLLVAQSTPVPQSAAPGSHWWGTFPDLVRALLLIAAIGALFVSAWQARAVVHEGRSLEKQVSASLEQSKALNRQVELLREQIELSDRTARSDRSLSIMARWNDVAFAERRTPVLEFLKDHPGPEAIQQKCDDDAEFQMCLGLICGHLEEMAVAFNSRTLDRELHARFFAGIVIKYHILLNSWIHYMREQTKMGFATVDGKVFSGILEEFVEMHEVVSHWVPDGHFRDEEA